MPDPIEEAREAAWRDFTRDVRLDHTPGEKETWLSAWAARSRYDEERIAALVDCLERAMQLIQHGDFRNGVTDSTCSIDEGEVRASQMYNELRALADQTEAERGGAR